MKGGQNYTDFAKSFEESKEIAYLGDNMAGRDVDSGKVFEKAAQDSE